MADVGSVLEEDWIPTNSRNQYTYWKQFFLCRRKDENDKWEYEFVKIEPENLVNFAWHHAENAIGTMVGRHSVTPDILKCIKSPDGRNLPPDIKMAWAPAYFIRDDVLKFVYSDNLGLVFMVADYADPLNFTKV